MYKIYLIYNTYFRNKYFLILAKNSIIIGLIDSVENDSVKEENKYEAEGSQKIVNSNGPFKGDDLSLLESCLMIKLND